MRLRLGPLTLPWPGRADKDPYWDFFLHQPVGDPRNLVTEIIRRAPEGAIYPSPSELHSPEVTARHLKELGHWLGAERVGIVGFAGQEAELSRGYPFAIVCVVRAEIDPRVAAGIGGQVAVQNGLYVTFILTAYIRELGYRAMASADAAAPRLAARAGVGTLNATDELVTPTHGSRVHVADVIRTDLPLVADG